MLISLGLNASSLIIGKFGRTGESQNPADLNWRGKGENLAAARSGQGWQKSQRVQNLAAFAILPRSRESWSVNRE
jgi:hypothetical protein